MLHWLLISAALLAADVTLSRLGDPLSPAPHHVALHKANLVSIGAWMGYWIDRAIAPYGRPDVFLCVAGKELVFAAAMLRRAVIVGCAMLVMGLGL